MLLKPIIVIMLKKETLLLKYGKKVKEDTDLRSYLYEHKNLVKRLP